ncbi:Aste57867_4765 [Aphanomyces stellatus]|uniref:Aste57867_4765 protein n=1 Tax=Aphanomyces stellatus TaxID=120398 RepID=A0A485KD87_9STRA|nr:hypothetical protein As57867_004752 [Aphanomyces stellatus]VFT81861.1 Aste57867_4765 [Aphanomyces stellatus]
MATTAPSTTGISLSLKVNYPVPQAHTMSDVLKHMQHPDWCDFIAQYTLPYLQTSSPAASAVVISSCLSTPTKSTGHACAICLNDADDDDVDDTDKTQSLFVVTPCGHTFHQPCLDAWFARRSTCPTCRYQFPTQYTGHAYAMKRVWSVIVLDDEVIQPDQVIDAHTSLGGLVLTVVVQVAMDQVARTAGKTKCQIHAQVRRKRRSPNDTEHDRPAQKRRCPERNA